ncbi:MAG: PE-PPE domain-containing protein [Mycobacteriaceae bacterium]
MRASWFIGRVGGLAIAFGVGAAVLGGTAVSWADSAPANPDAGSSAGTPARSAHPSTSARTSQSSVAGIRRATAAPAAVKATAPVKRTAAATVSQAALPDLSGAVPAGNALAGTALEVSRRQSPAARAVVAPAAAALAQPVILGPSGVPIPSEKYVDEVMNLYVRQGSVPPFADPQPIVVFTPEGLYPITGVESLPLNTSVDQGMTILSRTLAGIAPGTPTTVFGYSQSAIIGSLLQAGYNPPKSPYPPPTIPAGLQDFISFVFVGNEMNPNGGLLSRFVGLQLPSLGLTFYGATPENAYPTRNYTLEYDGFADFPRYPLNFLADLNAGLGIVFVHTQYDNPNLITAATVTPISAGGTAIQLPTTDPSQQYFFMPTKNLPLLAPLRLIPFIGNPIADLIQPALKVLVNLGYGDPAHGFETGVQPNANVLVPFGVFPQVDPAEVVGDFVAGLQQGVSDFVADFGPGGSIATEVSAMSSMLAAPGAAGQTLVTAIATGISGALASAYSAILPTLDILNAIVTVLPAYNYDLFLQGIGQALSGDVVNGIVNAIGRPIAADVGIITVAGLVEALVLGEAVAGVFGITLPT